jgi:hypothetical protein
VDQFSGGSSIPTRQHRLQLGAKQLEITVESRSSGSPASDNDLSRSSVSKKLGGRDINSAISVIPERNESRQAVIRERFSEVSSCLYQEAHAFWC